MTLRTRALATMALLGLAISVGLPEQASAQAPQQREPGVRYATRLGGSTRFTAPVRNVEALRRTFSRMNIQNDVGTVLTEAGIPQLRAEVLRNITEGTLTQVSIAPGTRME